MDKQNDINIRELRILEILKETLSLLRTGFKYCLPLCLLAFIPINIIELFLPGEAIAEVLLASPAALLEDGGMGAVMRNAMLGQLIRHIFFCLVIGGYTYLALARYSGKEVTLGSVMDYTFNKWLGIVLTGILFYFIIFATFIMIFPMIYFGIIFIFHRNIAAVTGERGFKALTASYALVRGSFFKRLLYAAAFTAMQMGLVALLVMLFVGTGIQPAAGAPLTVGTGILTVALNVITDTLSTIFVLAQAVWFVNILMTKRGGAALVGPSE